MFRSLRSKLLVLTIVVETVVLGAIVWNSQRLTEQHLLRQFELRRGEITILLQSALAPAMAQRDYASVSDTLQAAQSLQGMNYLVMFDEEGHSVAMANWDRRQEMPPVSTGPLTTLQPGNLHTRIPIVLEGRRYGQLQIGLDLHFLQEARRELFLQNLGLAGVGILVSALLLAAVAIWLTRRLDRLTEASHAFRTGQAFQPIRESGNDDIGVVVEAFNSMGLTLEARLLELQRSTVEQRGLAVAIETERGRLDALLAAMRLGLVFVAADGEVAYCNPAFRDLWQCGETGTGPGQSVATLRQTLLTTGGLPSTTAEALFKGDSLRQEFELADGRTITQFSVPVRGSGGLERGRLWIFDDVTSQRQTAERLTFLAERDPLTRLANRNRFADELARMMALANRQPEARGALLYFDIDEFKYINDTFGHRTGDAVLLQVAGVVSDLVRSNELLARLGGDEFVILVPDVDGEGASILAQRIVATVSRQVFEVDQRRLSLTVSLGIALFPDHARSAEELIARADAAMYQVKRAGKNGWRIYRPDLDVSARMLAELGWNERVRQALADNELVLNFQGIHCTRTGVVAHCEALVRIRDARVEGGLILPAQFLPAAERSGRIVEIDHWVITAAVRTLAGNPDLPAIAVNLSARTFVQPEAAIEIANALSSRDVDPRRLILELTETAALANLQDTKRFIADIRRIGCPVCLDDFGIGFSSFAYLKHLDAAMLKIDGIFIENLVHSREDQVFVRAIVDVAHGLGKATVAEFVGDEPTWRMLETMGVDFVQGFHLSRPRGEPQL